MCTLLLGTTFREQSLGHAMELALSQHVSNCHESCQPKLLALLRNEISGVFFLHLEATPETGPFLASPNFSLIVAVVSREDHERAVRNIALFTFGPVQKEIYHKR